MTTAWEDQIVTCGITAFFLPDLHCCYCGTDGRTLCAAPAPYAVLFLDHLTGRHEEHLRCVDHAADARQNPDLLAIKSVGPNDR